MLLSLQKADDSLDALVGAPPSPGAPGEGFGERVQLVLSLARGLLTVGLGAHQVEASLEQLGRSLGLGVDAFCTATALIITLKDGQSVRTEVVRVMPGSTDLERLSALHALVGRVVRKELTPDDAEERVLAILARPPRYGQVAIVGAYALVSTANAILLGGGGLDIPASGALGALVGMLDVIGQRHPAVERLAPAIAALVLSFASTALMASGSEVRPAVLLLAAIIVMLPGLTVTTAMIELASAHLVAGTGRLMGGATTLLQLAFGIALGHRLAALLPRVPRESVAPDLPTWMTVLAPFVAAIGFVVIFRSKPSDRWWILFGAALATIGARLGGWLLGAELGALVAALVVALAANAIARMRDRPSALVLVPGIVFIVPGSIGFLGVRSMLEDSVTDGIQTIFRMFLVAMAIAAGVLVATAALPPRRAL